MKLIYFCCALGLITCLSLQARADIKGCEQRSSYLTVSDVQVRIQALEVERQELINEIKNLSAELSAGTISAVQAEAALAENQEKDAELRKQIFYLEDILLCMAD